MGDEHQARECVREVTSGGLSQQLATESRRHRGVSMRERARRCEAGRVWVRVLPARLVTAPGSASTVQSVGSRLSGLGFRR